MNIETFARPECTLPSDGHYVPTQEDWDEFVASGEPLSGREPNEDPEENGVYDGFEDPSQDDEWMEDDSEYDHSDLYGAEHDFFEYPE